MERTASFGVLRMPVAVPHKAGTVTDRRNLYSHLEVGRILQKENYCNAYTHKKTILCCKNVHFSSFVYVNVLLVFLPEIGAITFEQFMPVLFKQFDALYMYLKLMTFLEIFELLYSFK